MDVKQQVREFYNQVGWQEVSDGVYQNAQYEDLRPVARTYITHCHQRVGRHLAPRGRYLLDAGSGPIQYPEYLAYSSGYQRRVCVDISIVALQEARKRIGEHGLFVVADVACLPFKTDCFDGAVSLHTIHHLPQEEHLHAYQEIVRTLAPGAQAAVVNGWRRAPLMRLADRVAGRLGLGRGGSRVEGGETVEKDGASSEAPKAESERPAGTFTGKSDAAWFKREIAAKLGCAVELRVWRTVSVRFLRTFIHPERGGQTWLRILYWLEERAPRFFGENGQYPLIIVRKKPC
jgi:SAM-dependent methyltransferase